MNWPFRITLATIVLASSLLAERLIRSHVRAVGVPQAVSLPAPLGGLPREVGQFVGMDRLVSDAAKKDTDDYMFREYTRDDGRSAVVWVAYSRDGSDRSHHPEVCMAVAGTPEDEEARTTLDVAEGGAPIQKYRFGFPGNYTCVYYWHYTMRAELPPDQTGIQNLYQTLRYRPASVTVEVFAPEQPLDSARQVDSFVTALENEIQTFLGPRAVRGSRRMPFQIIELQ